MKTIRITAKQIVAVLVVITVAFAAFTAGVYLGGRDRAGDYSVYTQRGGALDFELPESTPNPFPAATEVPRVPETAAAIDINTATAEELATLEGIGSVLAERIIAHREQIGGFFSTFELMDVPGIGESKYLAIKDKITVGAEVN